MLTKQELLKALTPLYQNESVARIALGVSIEEYRAIEAAVLSKLAAGVSVEPFFWVYEAGTPDGGFYFIEVDRTRKDENYRDKRCWEEYPVFTELQLAAARAQALEEAVKVCEGASSYLEHQQHLLASRDCANAIRALIGGAT